MRHDPINASMSAKLACCGQCSSRPYALLFSTTGALIQEPIGIGQPPDTLNVRSLSSLAFNRGKFELSVIPPPKTGKPED
jgi:hypothetical protein